MKNNKKGFTLIELLAVIVILAIIMVIAVPQILKVIDESRTQSWKNSVKMVENAIELKASMISPSSGSNLTTISDICQNGATILPTIVDMGDMTFKECNGGVFKFDGTGQFAGRKGKITCVTATGSCTSEFTY